MKRNKGKSLLLCLLLLCFSITACSGKERAETTMAKETTKETAKEATFTETTVLETVETAETETTEAIPETDGPSWETLAAEDVDVSSYEISGGTWFYTGIEDEKSIDMDGLKGFTAYTTEAIPETEGYLQYLGINPDGYHVFDVYDIYGVHFTTMTFVSEEQFYLGDDETEFYIKWNY